MAGNLGRSKYSGLKDLKFSKNHRKERKRGHYDTYNEVEDQMPSTSHHRSNVESPSTYRNCKSNKPRHKNYKTIKGHESGSRKSTEKYSKQNETKRTSTQITSNSSNDGPDIPGFYYDREKKRYFKIAPNHCKHGITNDTIAKQKIEEKRQQDLKRIFEKPAKRKPSVRNGASSLCLRSVGIVSSEAFSSNFTRTKVSNLRPLGSQYLFHSLAMCENVEHMQIMKVTRNCDEILGEWALKDTWVQRIQLLKMSELKRTSDKQPLSLHAEPHHKVIIQSLNKVTDMCWAPLQGEINQHHILYTTICHTGNLYSLAMIRSLRPGDDSQSSSMDYNLGKKASWSCAWNQHSQRFSVGSEKSALVLDKETRRMWEYYTNNSDPLVQTFANQGSEVLYTGTKKGELLVHDLRSRSTRPVTCLRHRSSVCGLHLLSDDTRIVAGDFTGKLCLWDLRKKGIVVEYSGGYNQYTKIPVHVDLQENIVYGVGQDGYTRFWNLRQGTLLHTIPPPCPVTRETIPTVHFSMNWADKPGNAGLVMGLENKLYFYGHLPVT